MIFLWIILDVLLNNFTSFTSFFFIVTLYNKPYKYFLFVGLMFDFILFNTYFYNIIIFTIIYFMNYLLKDLNKNNFYNFVFVNIYNYILYIILSNILFNNINNLLLTIGNNLLINLLFYVLSYRIYIKKYNKKY